MSETTATPPRSYGPSSRSSYHHRNVPGALRSAALEILEDGNP